MNVICILSDIFIAAMAVFGLWCVFQFLALDLTASGSIRCAVNIDREERIERLGSIICEIDRSALFAREEKYALLFDAETILLVSEESLPENISDRVEFFVRTEIKKKE